MRRRKSGLLIGVLTVMNRLDEPSGGRVGSTVTGGAVEELQELLVPAALHALPDHPAVEHVQGGEQGRGAVADGVVGHRAGSSLLHRQAGLGAVQPPGVTRGLDLALLVDREDDRMGRRIDVEPNQIADLAGGLASRG